METFIPVPIEPMFIPWDPPGQKTEEVSPELLLRSIDEIFELQRLWFPDCATFTGQHVAYKISQRLRTLMNEITDEYRQKKYTSMLSDQPTILEAFQSLQVLEQIMCKSYLSRFYTRQDFSAMAAEENDLQAVYETFQRLRTQMKNECQQSGCSCFLLDYARLDLSNYIDVLYQKRSYFKPGGLTFFQPGTYTWPRMYPFLLSKNKKHHRSIVANKSGPRIEENTSFSSYPEMLHRSFHVPPTPSIKAIPSAICNPSSGHDSIWGDRNHQAPDATGYASSFSRPMMSHLSGGIMNHNTHQQQRLQHPCGDLGCTNTRQPNQVSQLQSPLGSIYVKNTLTWISKSVYHEDRIRFATVQCGMKRKCIHQVIDLPVDEAAGLIEGYFDNLADSNELERFLQRYCPKMKEKTRSDLRRCRFRPDSMLLCQAIYDLMDSVTIKRRDFLWKMGIESPYRELSDLRMTRRDFFNVLEWWWINQAHQCPHELIRLIECTELFIEDPGCTGVACGQRQSHA